MSPLAARFDLFVRWFVNSSPSALIDSPVVAISNPDDRTHGVRSEKPAAQSAIAKSRS